ncbi:MAG: Flp pilus assembly pilin Flp [Paracoccaceae bacterium]|jgi:Flp pilus assembly pilin Flp
MIQDQKRVPASNSKAYIVSSLTKFLQSESGAVTVDWVVLTAAAAGLAIAATSVVSGGLESLAADLEEQLRTQQISDSFVQFRSSDFDVLYDAGTLTEEQATASFAIANEMDNAEILSGLEALILKSVDGTITNDEEAAMYAMASVAVQRNIIDASELQAYLAI